MTVQPRRDIDVAHPLSRVQHDPRPLHLTPRSGHLPRPPLELGALRSAKLDHVAARPTHDHYFATPDQRPSHNSADFRTRPLADWAAVMRELRLRDVIRTNNSPVGDIAEAIVAAFYGGERGGFSQAGWDVKTPQGERIQVKSMRTTETTKRRNVSPIRDSDYDSVVIVIFDEDFRVLEGLKMTREVVEELFAVRPYLNGRAILVSRALREDPRVEHVDLSGAAQRLQKQASRPMSRSLPLRTTSRSAGRDCCY